MCGFGQSAFTRHCSPEEVHPGRELKDILGKRSDTTIISADSASLRVEFRTFLGFVDDGLCVVDAINRLIHWRSAARSGYWDIGKNRRRLEEIRQQFAHERNGNP